MFPYHYGAPSLKAAEAEFERFKQAWSSYLGAVDVWIRNWQHIVQLFDYGSAVRKVMYTTNAIESVNSSFRKVTKKGAFPSEDALLKLLYLRIIYIVSISKISLAVKSPHSFFNFQNRHTHKKHKFQISE